jgi:hypothetical protein
VSVDWDEYTPDDSGVPRPLAEPPSAREARAAYERLLASKPERLRLLGRLLAANGVALGSTDDRIQAVNDWFRANVEADPAQPRQVSEPWWSVIRDLGLFLGDVMIERKPGLEWRFYAQPPKEGVGFRRPVIMGFDDPRYYESPELHVSGYAHGLLGTLRTRDPDWFLRVVNAGARLSPGSRAPL